MPHLRKRVLGLAATSRRLRHAAGSVDVVQDGALMIEIVSPAIVASKAPCAPLDSTDTQPRGCAPWFGSYASARTALHVSGTRIHINTPPGCGGRKKGALTVSSRSMRSTGSQYSLPNCLIDDDCVITIRDTLSRKCPCEGKTGPISTIEIAPSAAGEFSYP